MNYYSLIAMAENACESFLSLVFYYTVVYIRITSACRMTNFDPLFILRRALS